MNKDEMSKNNAMFERVLRLECAAVLREHLSAKHYVEDILNRLWDGEKYCDGAGDLWYFEIHAADTRTGQPCAVSI